MLHSHLAQLLFHLDYVKRLMEVNRSLRFKGYRVFIKDGKLSLIRLNEKIKNPQELIT